MIFGVRNFRVTKTHVSDSGSRTIGGRTHYFRSRWEANYCRYLEWLKQQKHIREWEYEPQTFWFLNIKRGVRSYLPDFRVTELNGAEVLHEVKGYMDAKSTTKLRRMKKYYPETKLLVIDKRQYYAIAAKVSRLIAEWETEASRPPDPTVKHRRRRRSGMSRGAALNAIKHGFRAQAVTGASNREGYVREKDDFYPTPERATKALLSVESFEGDIWEPACGDGAISKVFEAAGYRVASSDLVARGYGEDRVDFLMEYRSRAPNIVTNPPFKLAVPFVRKSLELTTRKVAMLLKIAFLEGTERALLFRNSPLARVHVFSRRLAFVPGGTSEARKLDGGGMMAFAWFVWDHAHSGRPEIHWL